MAGINQYHTVAGSCSTPQNRRGPFLLEPFHQSLHQPNLFIFLCLFTPRVILDPPKIYILVSYTNLPTGPWTLNLTSYNISIIRTISYTVTLLQALKSYPFFWNNFVVIGHSSRMWSTDGAFLQMHVTFCEYLVFHELRRDLYNYYSWTKKVIYRRLLLFSFLLFLFLFSLQSLLQPQIKSRWVYTIGSMSAPVATKCTQGHKIHVRFTETHSSGAVWESRWPSWAVRPNEPSGFRGRKDLLNHASALVTACP